VTFGAHQDRFRLDNPRFALADWRAGAAGALIANSQGKTRTRAIWAQDVWQVAPQVKLTVGARYEAWRAYDGLNFSAAPALNVRQPEVDHKRVSPKAVAAWEFADGWTLKGSAAIANRFPTVGELYQAVTTGAILSVPNPNLKPERARSLELSLERHWDDGEARIALFDERVHDTLLSQSGLLNGVTANFVQNVDRSRSTGVEVVAQKKDVLVEGLQVSGWVTYLDTEIQRDAALPAAVGKRLPQLPRWRGSLVATYSGIEKFDFTVAARYSDRAFGTIDNSDHYANTYQGFGAFFVVDLNASYQVNDSVSLGVGVTNVGDRKYFLFHPFPQRTVIADLKVTY
jgi:iron complex outermembrane receptor protein